MSTSGSCNNIAVRDVKIAAGKKPNATSEMFVRRGDDWRTIIDITSQALAVRVYAVALAAVTETT